MSNTEEMLNQAALIAKMNGEQIGVLSTQVKDHELRIRDAEKSIGDIKTEMETEREKMKQRERIEADEVNELNICMDNRIANLFHENDFSDDDFKKYFGKFKSKMWKDLKKQSFVRGHAGVDTKRMYFNDVKEYCGTWTPHGYGTTGYIEHLDSLKK